MRKPFWNRARNQWYVWQNGKQVALGSDKDAAFLEWHRQQSLSEPDSPEAPTFVIIEAFLEWSAENQSPRTTAYYQPWLQSFALTQWHTPVADLRPHHVTAWLARRGLPDGSKRAAIRSVQRALNWAYAEGLIVANPLAKIAKPPEGRRERLVAADSHQEIREATDPQFRLVATALRHLGCRPEEVRLATADHFDDRMATWVFIKHKTSAKTQRKRIVYLTPCMTTLSRILAAARPTGPLFLNARGLPWSENALRCRMRRLRKKLDLPAGTVAYSYRHTFTTEGLVNGVGTAAMAEMLGHRDTSMIDRHYGHLDQRAEHLKEAAAKASGFIPAKPEPPKKKAHKRK